MEGDAPIIGKQPIYHLTIFPIKNGLSRKLIDVREVSCGKVCNQKTLMVAIIAWSIGQQSVHQKT
jgi:hypothetical protein